MLISLIITTYNRPEALKLVLQSTETQTDQSFEVIVADDGSTPETGDLIAAFKKESKKNVKHVWHEDLGFRAGAVRNLAMREAVGEYIIFLDGDCILQPDFVARHRSLAEAGMVVTGGRILLGEVITKELISQGLWNYANFRSRFVKLWIKKELNKLFPLVFKVGDHFARRYKGFVWRRIKSCNLACWKVDAIKVGGFDENITGWGHEDADFVFRLHVAGVNRKSASWATEVFHLFHPEADKTHARKNEELVQSRIRARYEHPEKVNRFLESRKRLALWYCGYSDA